MVRPAQVSINHDALSHNLGVVRSLVGDCKILAVVKADGYGHSLEAVAETFRLADAMGVACLDEAVRLRELGVVCPILLLEGVFEESELIEAKRLDLSLTVHCEEQLTMLERHPAYGPFTLWVKIDSGMHRLGFSPHTLPAVVGRLSGIAQRQSAVLMTHMTTANVPQSKVAEDQLRAFSNAKKLCPQYLASVCNSGAILNFKSAFYHWVRPGIMLYGISPITGETGADHQLRPAMTFASKIIATRYLAQGDTIGYGASWRCPEAMPIGIVAAGYGDGYPRQTRMPPPILINGHRTQVIGHPSMDMLAVDLRPIPNASVGDTAILWGNDCNGHTLPIEEVAEAVGTIPYVLSCAVHPRLNF